MAADPSKEPSAVNRQAAREMFGLFNALVGEGFTEKQALSLLGSMLSAHIARPKGDDDAG